MKKRIIQFVFILLLLAVGYFRITRENRKPISETKFAMGTFVTINIKDHNKNNQTIIDSAFSLISHYENIFSITKENSEVNQLNKSNLNSRKISDDFMKLINKAKEISSLSNGAFDITIGIILNDYDFINKKMPTDSTIKKLLPHINYKNLKVKNNKLIKDDNKIQIDLGGIAKGFIIDKVREYLQNKGIRNAVINAGGDLYLMENPDKDGWTIGIRNPRKEGEIFGKVSLKNKAIVTSGDYEQFFIKKGKRIHHIINPETGLPADKSISVTVIADDTCTADGLCTAIFVLGPEKGIKLANSLKNVEAMVIHKKADKLKYVTSKNFAQFNLEVVDKNYSLQSAD